MKRHFIILNILFLLIFSLTAYPQKFKKFSSDIAKYPEGLNAFMLKNPTPENKKFIEDFVTRWGPDSLFSEEEKLEIIDISNKLIRKKVRPYPDFKNYLSSLLIFKDTSMASSVK